MYSIFEKLLKEKNVTVADVCRATGIRQSTMSNWKKRGNSLTAKNAKLVAEYFGVSVDYLYGNSDKDETVYDIRLRALVESQLKLDGWSIEHINPASDKPCEQCSVTYPQWIEDGCEERKQLCDKCVLNDAICVISKGNIRHEFSEEDYSRLIMERQAELMRSISNTERGKEAFRIPVVGRVAAGIPINAIEEVIDWEELPSKFYKTGTYFGLLIKGNSMEPGISNGDVVIVKEQPDAEDGQVVVAIVNGDDGVCKRLKKYPDGRIALLSDNPAYPPMYFDSAEIDTVPIRILGVVKELRRRF